MLFAATLLLKNVNYKLNYIHKRFINDTKWNVLFFGTDNFSLFSLERIYNKYVSGSHINNLEVVTNLKSRQNAVYKFANEANLPVHPWPLQLPPQHTFHIGVVVSFGHLLPEAVIKLFPLGMLNVHASLLPRWRGAAPVVHTLLNGDSVAGVSIMKIRPKYFDIGEIILQEKVPIGEDMMQPELYEALGTVGAELLIQCIDTLPDCLNNAKPQDESKITQAPKISQLLGVIPWKNKTGQQIYNLSRALYGIYPLRTTFKEQQVKLYQLHLWKDNLSDSNENIETKLPGYFKYIRRKKVIRVWCKDGSSIYFDSISLPGKKIMSAIDFKNGFLKHVPESEHFFTFDPLLCEKIVVKS